VTQSGTAELLAAPLTGPPLAGPPHGPATRPALVDDACTSQAQRARVGAARDLLARTFELPASGRDLLAVLSEYRAALHAFTTDHDVRPGSGVRAPG
jgi:hypothetical protein